MTQKEIIEFEETNTEVIRLYLEGSFYKAYERNPFALQAIMNSYSGYLEHFDTNLTNDSIWCASVEPAFSKACRTAG